MSDITDKWLLDNEFFIDSENDDDNYDAWFGERPPERVIYVKHARGDVDIVVVNKENNYTVFLCGLLEEIRLSGATATDDIEILWRLITGKELTNENN